MNDKELKKGKKNLTKTKLDAAETDKTLLVAAGDNSIKTRVELKNFLLSLKDKMSEETAAPVHVFAALNYVLMLSNIYDLLDQDNKEVARDLWLRLKQCGIQLRNPPLLFSEEEEATMLAANNLQA